MPKVDTRVENHKATIYKTKHFMPDQVERMQESATRQEKIIGRIFVTNPNKLFGPRQLHEQQGFKWPITSTRRAFTNLTETKEIKDDDGFVIREYPAVLVKTDQTRPTSQGRNEHKWRWKKPDDFDQQAKQINAFGKPEPKSRAYNQ